MNHKIEKNIPVPPRPLPPICTNKYHWKPLLLALKEGESVLLKNTKEGNSCAAVANFYGIQITRRKQTDGTCRVWREPTSKKPRSRALRLEQACRQVLEILRVLEVPLTEKACRILLEALND